MNASSLCYVCLALTCLDERFNATPTSVEIGWFQRPEFSGALPGDAFKSPSLAGFSPCTKKVHSVKEPDIKASCDLGTSLDAE